MVDKEEEKQKWEMLYNNTKHFQIPIDNYILQAAFESNEWKQNPQCFDKQKDSSIWIHKVDATTYKIKFEEGKAGEYTWSQISTYERYLQVQNVLLHLAGANPLDWENDKWLGIADKRKNGDG